MKADTSTIRNALTAATFDALEKMFYIFLEPASGDRPRYDMETSIRFAGPCSGQLKVLYSRELAETMAGNLLYREKGGITDNDLEDCAKEAINIICGSFLTKIESRKAFKLSLPVFRGLAGAAAESDPPEDQVGLDFEANSGRLGVRMALAGDKQRPD